MKKYSLLFSLLLFCIHTVASQQTFRLGKRSFNLPETQGCPDTCSIPIMHHIPIKKQIHCHHICRHYIKIQNDTLYSYFTYEAYYNPFIFFDTCIAVYTVALADIDPEKTVLKNESGCLSMMIYDNRPPNSPGKFRGIAYYEKKRKKIQDHRLYVRCPDESVFEKIKTYHKKQ